MNTLHSGPPIVAVPEGQKRPMISVMIPTYNCASFLEEALASVLAEGIGEPEMEIVVVDDCSTDDPGTVVSRLGGGRVRFVRHGENLGAVATFNDCIQRSTGQLIHILHGDDFILPNFYSEVLDLASRYPDAALLGTRTFYVDKDGIPTGVSPLLPTLSEASRDASPMLEGCKLQFASVVIRRGFYETFGGFRPDLIGSADWEMWIRAIHLQGGVISPRVCAAYRRFDGNDTSTLRKTGENIRDYERCAKAIAPHFSKRQMREFRLTTAAMSVAQVQFLRSRGDPVSARLSSEAYRKATPASVALWRFARQFRQALRELRVWAGV